MHETCEPQAAPAAEPRAVAFARAVQTPALPSLIGNRAMGRLLARTAAAPPAAGGLTQDMLTQIARRLREAMEGWGTDEEAIYSALSGRTPEQVAAIAKAYRDRYKRDLGADLKDELSDSELRKLAIFNPQPAPAAAAPGKAPAANPAAELAARQLHKAMSGLGTDEEAIFATLTGRTADELKAIKAAYQGIAKRTLEADLRDELSGSDLTQALRLLQQGVLQAEDELYLSMAGAGTDEATAYRVLEANRDPAAMAAMEQRYRAKYGDMVGDIRGDFSGGEYKRAMDPVRPVLGDVAFENCPDPAMLAKARSLVPTAIQKTDKAIRVLSAGWSRMTAAQRDVFNDYFDPAGTGEVDAQFVADVLANFRAIRREFDGGLTFECVPAGGMCTGGRLYYTHWGNVFVCPYFMTETSDERRARDIVHELAHNAMHAVDRPYFGDGHGHAHGTGTDPRLSGLSPRGSWPLQIPVLGQGYRLIGGISHLIWGPETGMLTDTLHHPDAYSMFAFRVP